MIFISMMVWFIYCGLIKIVKIYKFNRKKFYIWYYGYICFFIICINNLIEIVKIIVKFEIMDVMDCKRFCWLFIKIYFKCS